MKKVINKKTYNTETATEVKRNTVSFFGDPLGYEEVLYKTAKGDFFVYGVGGEESKYAEETIIALTAKDAKEF
ncbi:MAG: hypothetical protein LBL82_08910 [Oscillospiraceae bacterium]|jgi:hypothetical protein|nr:hypothetical protein [Oscillospiraceae bacterium]